VVVEDVEQRILYVFSCYRWFEKGKDDGAVMRELTADEPAKEEPSEPGVVEIHETVDIVPVEPPTCK